MHPAAPSVKYFGVYAAVAGAGLMLSPALILSVLGVAAPTEVWVRVVGGFALVVGYYYWACGTASAIAFFRASVGGRIAFAAILLLLVLVFGAPLQLLVFGAIDVIGAAWTANGLRKPSDAARSLH